MSESKMRRMVTRALKPLDARAVENPCLPGTPDVNYVEGWIELKWLRQWPVHDDTIVHIEHYTQDQKVWAFLRRRAGGQCWFLLQVRREWILLDGAIAALTVNRATREELIKHATAYWDCGLEGASLIKVLQQRQEPYIFTPEEFALLRETQ